ncbi:MAG: DHHW family protein [Muribaculum sp.]|nr:DHHW family protein [Muribaculum sp.]
MVRDRLGKRQAYLGQFRRDKLNAGLTVGIFCVIVLVLTAADLMQSDRLFSETENRLLASRPEPSVGRVLDGSFMEAYETYVTDQFVERDKWIGIKTGTDLLLQKREINGVYLGRDGYLIEKHDPRDYPAETVRRKLELLETLTKRWDARVMLVPTADNVLTDRMPPYAEFYDQRAFLEEVRSRVGEARLIDVYPVLLEHSGEEIYYRTDHHWTSLGAWYGYRTWAEAMGEIPQVSPQDAVTVAEDFLGTLHARLNFPVEPDRIEYFPATTERPVRLLYDMQTETDSCYEEKYLAAKNKYGYFLDDNHAFIEMDTSLRNGRTLFVLKDSYANCMIPLLAMHYEKIYVVDLRYLNGKLFPFMECYEPETGMDVLVLYNCIHFLEEFRYW